MPLDESEEASVSRAIEYTRFGGPEVLGEVERPAQALGDGEVRIAVRAVGLNPADFKTFKGDLRPVERIQRLIHPRRWFERSSAHFPRGVARDFAGVIDAVGAGVTDLAVGDAVLGTLRSAPGQADTRGALTTELVAPADDVIKKPTSMSFTQAACLGVASQTACGAFRQLNLHGGDVIVISAAAGGVGSIAAQLALSRGATVIGIAGARNIDYLRSLGTIPVPYGEDLTRRVREAAPSPVIKLLDCYGHDYVTLGRELGLPRRSIGTLVPSPAAILKGAQFTGSRHSSGRGDLEEVAQLVADDVITVEIAHTYSFTVEQVRAAYTDLMTGHVRGKLVVDLS